MECFTWGMDTFSNDYDKNQIKRIINKLKRVEKKMRKIEAQCVQYQTKIKLIKVKWLILRSFELQATKEKLARRPNF